MPTCVVLGMHRSGTSVVARAVNLLGFSLGDRSLLMRAADDNPTGFFESRPLVSFDDDLLRRLGGSWEAPPLLPDGWEHEPSLPTIEEGRALVGRVFGADRSHILWKDPRASLLMPYWRRVMPIDHTILVLRDPREVADSLSARNGIDRDWAHYLWLRYVAAAVTSTDQPTVVVFDEVLRDPAAWLEDLGLRVGAHPTTEQVAAFVSHADPALGGNQDLHEHVTGALGELAVEVYEHLRAGREAGSLGLLPQLARGDLDGTGHRGLAEMRVVQEALTRVQGAVVSRMPAKGRWRGLLATPPAKVQMREAAEDPGPLGQLRDELNRTQTALTAAQRQAATAQQALSRLRGRRSVRLALAVARLTRPAFRLLRRG